MAYLGRLAIGPTTLSIAMATRPVTTLATRANAGRFDLFLCAPPWLRPVTGTSAVLSPPVGKIEYACLLKAQGRSLG